MTTTTLSESKVHQAVDYINNVSNNFVPKLGLVLGSGLGVLANEIENPVTISYDDIPGFFNCSVAGHGGHLYLGMLKGIPVACLQGRAHFYEGISHDDVLTPVRTLRLLGCETLVSTNASGSLREAVTPGNLVLIKDHINFQFNNPLVGRNADEFGPRFVGMEDTYDEGLRATFKKLAHSLDMPLTDGVYFGVLGPTFETPAEIRAFKMLGGDVVGMSTIPEVVAARHCGLKVAVIAVVTNMAAGLSEQKLSHDVTLAGAKLGADNLIRLIHAFLDQYE
jgi:xanthosine phosphorylase